MTEQQHANLVERGDADADGGRAAELARAWAEAETARRGVRVGEDEEDRMREVLVRAMLEAEHRVREQVTGRLDELSQMIVHELQNPLTQVQVGAEMLQKRAETLREDERMYLGWIERGVARAAQVLEDVRVLALIEASQAGPRRVAIASVVEGVLARVREQAERAGVECGVEGELPAAMVDGAQVGMALGNLVANGVKYADPEKPARWVRVRVERVSGVVEGWRFSVADNGLGIPARLQRDVFRRHFRAHPEAAAGMGLGLSIARQVIERRHGHIWFHSEERKGSVFHFVVPDAEAAPAAASASGP